MKAFASLATVVLCAVGAGVADISTMAQGTVPASRPTVERSSCSKIFGEPLKIANPKFGNTVRTRNLVIEAVCSAGVHGGWIIRATRRQGSVSSTFESARLPLTSPVAILAVYYFSPRRLPAILAQVGYGMTGQPYELLTFVGDHIARVEITFPPGNPNIGGLAGGGAALHGQGVFCSQADNRMLLTQANWEIDAPIRWIPYRGGVTPAPSDRVTIYYDRWTLGGQPLHQLEVRTLSDGSTTYVKAQHLENAHC